MMLFTGSQRLSTTAHRSVHAGFQYRCRHSCDSEAPRAVQGGILGSIHPIRNCLCYWFPQPAFLQYRTTHRRFHRMEVPPVLEENSLNRYEGHSSYHYSEWFRAWRGCSKYRRSLTEVIRYGRCKLLGVRFGHLFSVSESIDLESRATLCRASIVSTYL